MSDKHIEGSIPSTFYFSGGGTVMLNGNRASHCCEDLLQRYHNLIESQRLSWTEHHRLLRKLGSGGQGVVYLSERRGADNFTLPVAIKIFSPLHCSDRQMYDEEMGRIAQVAARIAQIQQDNLLDVHNFVDRNRIRLMEMEWIDGFDLSQILAPELLKLTYHTVSSKRWEHINNVIVTSADRQSRLKPGVAFSILRQCLAALAALHREGIVHGDIKPSNIMVKRTGNAKIIDVGSAFDFEMGSVRRACTPTYAAPEMLDGTGTSPRSDLCSLGYVLIEMLSGAPPFFGYKSFAELMELKRTLVHRLHEILPREVVCNQDLVQFIRILIAPDPNQRYISAEAADLVKEGAANFLRQLVKCDLASEYEHELRLWLKDLE